jgi:predicted oxidoreductase
MVSEPQSKATCSLRVRERRDHPSRPGECLSGYRVFGRAGVLVIRRPVPGGQSRQQRMGIHDSRELAWQDWLGTAGSDRPEDEWPRRWAEAYVDFAAGEKRA